MVLPAVSDIPGFWTKVKNARNRFLALDYDGTLAPFKTDRTKAFPLGGIIEVLIEIKKSKATSLAVISGRPVDEIIKFIGDICIIIVGSHGSEILYPSDKIESCAGGKNKTCKVYIFKPDEKQQRRFMQAEQEALASIGISNRGRLEKKHTSIAFHTRGLPQKKAEELNEKIFALWSKDSLEKGLECRHFNGGLELRCIGIHKGIAVEKLLENQPKDIFSIYIGDDDTDEDAFKVIKKRGGIGIRVGSPYNRTSAIGYLPDIKSVYDFLKGWADVTIKKWNK